MNVWGAFHRLTTCALVALIFAPGCYAPSYPEPTCEDGVGIQWVSDNEVVIHSKSCAWPVGIEVIVKNWRMQVWVGNTVDGDGAFTSEPLHAVEGDILEVIVAVAGERSHHTCLLVAAEPITLPECPDP